LPRSGVSSAIAAGLLVVGILIGAAGMYAATNQTKVVTQTETTTANQTATATMTLPGVGTEFVFGGSSQNSSISVAVNETFVIQFSSSAYDGGYVWKVNTSAGIRYLHNTGTPSSSACTGCPYTYDYYFRAVQGGTQTMTLQAKRPFAPYDIAATINLKVVVFESSSTDRSKETCTPAATITQTSSNSTQTQTITLCHVLSTTALDT